MEDQPRTRTPLRIALWIVAALVAFVLVAWGALAVAFPPARVREMVSARLSDVLARDVKFADASLGIWPPVRLSVQRPALAEPGGFANGSALKARSLHLDLDLSALFSRKVVVRRLVVDRPELHLVLRPDGTTNFDGIMKPAPDRKPADAGAMSLEIRELRIQTGRALVDEIATTRRTAFDIESTISLEAEAGGTRFGTAGETVLSGVAFGPLDATRMADLNRSLDALEWKLAHDGKFDTKQKRLALAKLTLGLGRARLGLSGVIDEPGPRAMLDLKARGVGVELGDVLEYLAAADARAVHGVKGAGKLDFDLHIRGMPGPRLLSQLEGTVSIAKGAFRYPGAPAGIEGLAFTARFVSDSLTIGDLRAQVAGQQVRAALFATRFADPWVRFAVQGDLDLGAVGPLLAPRDAHLGGRAAVNVRGSGRAKDPGDLALEGTARLADVSVQSPALPNRIEGVRGDIRFSPQRASLTGFSARAGKSTVALEATVERPLALLAPPPTAATPAKSRIAPAVVNFNAASTYLDLAEFLPTTPGAPVLPNATGEGRVTIGHLKSQKLDVSDVGARVRLEPGILSVPEFSMRAYGGTAIGNARFDMTDPAHPAYSVKTQVDSLEADHILSAWTPVKGLLHGSLATTLNLSGAGLTPDDMKRTITAVGLALVADGTLGPGPVLEAVARYTRVPALKQLRFKDGRVPFRIERGRVITDPVVIDGPHGEWRLIGSVGFDGSLDYAVSGTLPPEVAQRIGASSALAAGALSDPQGRMLLDLRLTGTATAPQIAWDGDAMRDRLVGKASQALEAQRARLEGEARAAAESRMVAAQDSARAAVERARRAAADSLKRRAGDALKGFFGGGSRDTTQQP